MQVLGQIPLWCKVTTFLPCEQKWTHAGASFRRQNKGSTQAPLQVQGCWALVISAAPVLFPQEAPRLGDRGELRSGVFPREQAVVKQPSWDNSPKSCPHPSL